MIKQWMVHLQIVKWKNKFNFNLARYEIWWMRIVIFQVTQHCLQSTLLMMRIDCVTFSGPTQLHSATTLAFRMHIEGTLIARSVFKVLLWIQLELNHQLCYGIFSAIKNELYINSTLVYNCQSILLSIFSNATFCRYKL